jgi:hypothetical protein
MCVSSAWHQLDAGYAEDEQKILQNKARQIWTTPLKALHFFFISVTSADSSITILQVGFEQTRSSSRSQC